jgi:Protein of unknown function (DUF3617)
MRKSLSIAVICLLASVALAAATGKVQPLKVKTGVWQMTQTVTWTGLPPQMAAMNGHTTKYKSCVMAKDLDSNPWEDGTDDKCTWTVLNSTGTDMEVKGTSCEAGKEYGMTAEIHGKIHIQDSENGTGTMEITMTGNGQTMHGHATYTGKWIGATCPADLN